MSARAPYYRDDPNEIRERYCKSYGCHELVIEVCLERGLPCKLIKPDANADFLVIAITSTRAEYKSAQLEWCRRMAVSPKRMKEAVL